MDALPRQLGVSKRFGRFNQAPPQHIHADFSDVHFWQALRTVTDPHTQQVSSGRWIGYSTWRRHAKEEKTRIKLQQSGDGAIPFEANFLAETLSEPHAEDSVISSRSMQIQHSLNRLPGRPVEGELCRVDVDMVDISQTSVDVTHDANEKLGLLAEYHMLFLSQKSCFPLTATVVFNKLPELSSPDTPGPLDGKKSAFLLAHKSAIEKTIELVGSVSNQNHASVWTARYSLI
ncbi:hypothetical protein EDD15DRAFT_2200071 [Pisolithus albus]|nr:hypothetical protein EDD15DRAFT_2200071 [Pisolithus albus]